MVKLSIPPDVGTLSEVARNFISYSNPIEFSSVRAAITAATIEMIIAATESAKEAR